MPLANFSNNLAYASAVGASIQYNLRGATHGQRSYATDNVLWNNEDGFHVHYSQGVTLDNVTIYRDANLDDGTGIVGNAVTSGIHLDSVSVVGYKHGVEVPKRGETEIRGGFFNNLHNIIVRTPLGRDRSLLITGPIAFGELPSSVRGTLTQREVLMWTDLRATDGRTDHLFYTHSVTLDYGPYSGQRLYYSAQARTAIPFPQSVEGIPAGYVGKTNAQLSSQFGVIVGGEFAPDDAVTTHEIVGLIGPP